MLSYVGNFFNLLCCFVLGGSFIFTAIKISSCENITTNHSSAGEYLCGFQFSINTNNALMNLLIHAVCVCVYVCMYECFSMFMTQEVRFWGHMVQQHLALPDNACHPLK